MRPARPKKRARTAAADLPALLAQLHGTDNKKKLAVLERLREILDVGNGTEYEAILAAGAAVADNVVPMLEAHKVVKLPAAKVIYLTLGGLEDTSDETTHPILGRADMIAQVLVYDSLTLALPLTLTLRLTLTLTLTLTRLWSSC